MMMREKLDFGSIFPVISSTVSIYWKKAYHQPLDSFFFHFVPMIDLDTPAGVVSEEKT